MSTPECDCATDHVPGTFITNPDENGVFSVQRCDGCMRFDSDFAAAEAIIAIYGGRIFFHQEGEVDDDDTEPPVHEWTGQDDDTVCIAFGTSCWIEGARPMTTPTPNMEVPA